MSEEILQQEVKDQNGAKAEASVELKPDEKAQGVVEGEAKPQNVTNKRKKISLEEIEDEILAKQNNFGKFPDFSIGDTIRVNVKIIEGDKQRIQPYEGTVIAIKHGKNRKTFTVRRVSYGVAVERIFPYHSPVIDSIEIVRRGKARRAKLYYLRKRYGRSAVLTEKV